MMYVRRKIEMKEIKSFISNRVAILSACLVISASVPVLAADSIDVSVSVSQQVQNAVNWNQGKNSDIIAVGISRPDSRGMALAREAAVMAAQRNLISIAQGLQINSETTMRDLIIESDVVNRNITGVLRGAQIVEENSLSDGGYYVKMRVPLYGISGSVAAAIMPTLLPATPAPFAKPNENAKIEQTHGYTGVVIDASGLGLEPTFSPVIYDDGGRVIYGVENLQYDAVINEGMVGYSHNVNEGTERAGNTPLIIKATQVRGGDNSTNKVNVVVSSEDADKILLANESSQILERCAVVFVR